MSKILDHPLISQRYFFPRREPPPEPFIVETSGLSLACIHHAPLASAPTLIHFHGNGEVVNDYPGPYLQSLQAIGLNCLLAEYRGYGGSDGRPQLAAMLDDVVPIMDSLGIARNKLILFGRSLGSLYAVHGAAQAPEVAGLIIESGVADLGERLLLRVQPDELGCTRAEFDAAIAADFDHQAKLAQYPGPVLILHTRHDGLVDLRHAELHLDWARGRKTLEVFEHGNHNNIMAVNAVAYFTAIQRFVGQL
jgi:hypothetical protein